MRTLVLNSSHEFLGITNWKDALSDAVVGNCTVLKEYDDVIRSQYEEFRKPAVVIENSYVHVKWTDLFRVSYSSRNVFIRDAYECQYCGNKTSQKRLSQEESIRLAKKGRLETVLRTMPSIDHVIPVSAGGPTTWENTVCACRGCNSAKSDISLEVAGMKLKREPKRPRGFKSIFEMKIGQIHDLWYEYLEPYWLNES